MGYYSDTFIITTEDVKNRIFEACKKYDDYDYMVRSCNITNHTDSNGNELIEMYWCIKWYENYPIIQDIMNIVNECIDNGTPMHYERFGEDREDYEYLDSGTNIWIRTSYTIET